MSLFAYFIQDTNIYKLLVIQLKQILLNNSCLFRYVSMLVYSVGVVYDSLTEQYV